MLCHKPHEPSITYSTFPRFNTQSRPKPTKAPFRFQTFPSLCLDQRTEPRDVTPQTLLDWLTGKYTDPFFTQGSCNFLRIYVQEYFMDAKCLVSCLVFTWRTWLVMPPVSRAESRATSPAVSSAATPTAGRQGSAQIYRQNSLGSSGSKESNYRQRAQSCNRTQTRTILLLLELSWFRLCLFKSVKQSVQVSDSRTSPTRNMYIINLFSLILTPPNRKHGDLFLFLGGM